METEKVPQKNTFFFSIRCSLSSHLQHALIKLPIFILHRLICHYWLNLKLTTLIQNCFYPTIYEPCLSWKTQTIRFNAWFTKILSLFMMMMHYTCSFFVLTKLPANTYNQSPPTILQHIYTYLLVYFVRFILYHSLSTTTIMSNSTK